MTDHDASRGRYFFFALAGLGVLMSSVDVTIVAMAIPSLTKSLDTSVSWVGWTVTAYQLVLVVALPIMGKLSDDLGRKRVFMFCTGCFTVGSLLCGLSPNIGFLIVFRVIQAIGAGGLMPSAFGIVSDQFKERRSQALGLYSSVISMGTILGPILGAWILENWTWREIFFVNLPFGLAMLIGTHLTLKGESRGGLRQQLDWRGLVLFAGGTIMIMLAMTMVGTDIGAVRSPLLHVLIVAGATSFWLFWKQERKAAQPIIDTELVGSRRFIPINIYNFFLGFCVFGVSSFIPYFGVVQYGMTEAQNGAILTPRGLTMITFSTITSLLILRIGYRIPMITGMSLLAGSFFFLSFGWNQWVFGPMVLDSFWLMAAELAIAGIGIGLAAPAANNAMIDLLPDRAASMTGLRGTLRFGGGVLGASATVLALSFFGNEAEGLRTVFLSLAVLLLATAPLALAAPDVAARARGEAPGAEVTVEEAVPIKRVSAEARDS